VARDDIRRGPRRNFAGLVVTLALHGAILLTVARAHGKEEAPLIMRHDFVEAEMVKLGKPRDKFWLPRIVQPPRATAPPDALKVAEDPNAKAAPREAPRPDDPLISKDLKRALERAKKLEALATPEEPDEGSLTGSLTKQSKWPQGDWRNLYFVPENLNATIDHVEELRPVVPAGMTMAEMALRFILMNPTVSTIIPGMRKARNAESNLAASDAGALDAALYAELRKYRWDRTPTAWSY